MAYLDLITILCTGLMIGNELAVWLFVNPAMRRLEDGAQATALGLLAQSLGSAMPFWYAAGLALIVLEAVLRRHQSSWLLLVGAVSLWAAAIVFTLLVLVPINNRIKRIDGGTAYAGWHQEHLSWDRLHRVRVLALIVAEISLVWSLVGTR